MTGRQVIIIGAGPAGLMAAERLAQAGVAVTVYDRMPTVGRKMLMAGRGGLNITHAEDLAHFVTRYGAAAKRLTPIIEAFSPTALRAWCEDLGCKTFVGSSGRVFPEGLKASPLLRAWLKRLQTLGVTFRLQMRWQGWDDEGALFFSDKDGQKKCVQASAVLLALGGASWSRLGSDGAWVDILKQEQIPVAPLRPANCGFIVPWSEHFRSRFEGQPVKSVMATYGDQAKRGEIMVTEHGVEGSLIYAFGAALRDDLEKGIVALTLDLRPDFDEEELAKRLQAPRGSQSLSNHLRKAGGLSPVAIGLLHEIFGKNGLPEKAKELARCIKTAPLQVTATAGIERAISSAGGIPFLALNDDLMLKSMPGVFAAGEMLNWEAPTGGYLMQGCFSTGVRAAEGILRYSRASRQAADSVV